MPETAIDWDKHIATVKAMWAAGSSASQIALVIPHATRSAILGKIMRLKLPARDKGHASPGMGVSVRRAPMSATPVTPRPLHNVTRLQAKANGHDQASPERRNPTNSLAEKIAIAEAEPVLVCDDVVPMSQRVTLMGLNKSTCRWPIGDPANSDFFFCGGKAIKGVPYCARHCRIAYQPSQARGRPSNQAGR